MKTLRWQILLPIDIALFVILALLTTAVSVSSNNVIRAATEDHLAEMTTRHATEIEVLLTDAMTASSVAASDYSALLNSDVTQKDVYDALVVNSLANSPSYYTGIWIVWNWEEQPGLPSTSRYTRAADGGVKDEGFRGDQGFYAQATTVTKSTVFDPVLNENGQMTAHFVAPIVRHGQIVGAVGFEVSMEKAAQNLANFNHYEGDFGRLIDSQGNYIVHEDTSKVATRSGDGDITVVSATGVPLTRFDPTDTMAKLFTVLEPVSIFNMDKAWTLQYTVPYDNAVSIVNTLRLITIAFAVGALLLIGSIVVYIISTISRPISKLADIAQSVAEGNTSQEVKITSKTEIGTLEKAIAQVSGTFGSLTYDMERLSNGIQQGDLSVTIDAGRYQGDYRRLAEGMNEMVSSIALMVSDLRDVAGDVASSAEQISVTSQGIAQGAAEQAATVDGIAASLGQVTNNTRNNAERAGTANALTDSVRKQALESGEKMNQLVEAVEMIDEASQAVANIIKNINDIAFQINLLSLNAAVEAARAGQAGRGFSVVAEEVKILATHATNSAQETQQLIANSMQRAKNGVSMAKDTQRALDAIVNSMDDVARTIGDIAAATQEQAASIEIVDSSIDQVSAVIQQNTATAEESAAASVQMDEQATNMSNILSRYHVAETGLPQGRATDKLLPPGRH